MQAKFTIELELEEELPLDTIVDHAGLALMKILAGFTSGDVRHGDESVKIGTWSFEEITKE